jgi:transposase
MRKIKEVLRLKLHLGLTEREVARSCSMARSTVSQYVERAKEAGLTWPLPRGMGRWPNRKSVISEDGRKRRTGSAAARFQCDPQ